MAGGQTRHSNELCGLLEVGWMWRGADLPLVLSFVLTWLVPRAVVLSRCRKVGSGNVCKARGVERGDVLQAHETMATMEGVQRRVLKVPRWRRGSRVVNKGVG
jgi:hypothetical protein